MKKLIGFAALVALGLAACEAPPEVVSGTNTINAADLANHIETLSSDEFEGRAPSSPGEEKTVAYIAEYFNAYGLRPGNGESYFQEVPLVDITASADQQLVITGPDVSINLRYADDYVAGTRRVVDRIDVVMSEMIFVGYGIVAPEYGWNDYQGIDMTGKTAVILVNDPGYATRDESLFTGYAMTYYGRWTYKYEEAMRQGADAAIVIHETGPAGYPWAVVRGGWTGQQFYLESADGNMSRSKIEGWITGEAAEAIFAAAGLDLAALTAAASNKGFKPVSMGLAASLSFSNEINHSRSRNVVGIVPGSEKPDEYFLYMAHWDHLGIGEADDSGDNIYNGALDNASGIAALLELAEAFGSLKTAPKRTMVFLATTAEEQGLLGSEHYGENPLFPLNKTIAGLNMDGLNLIGRTRDIVVTGFGLSEMDAYLEKAAAAQGRVLAPDPDVEKGYYYRSDHFNLAKKGVPMIYPGGGIDHVEFGSDYGQAQANDYVANRYHKPSDEYDPSWDLSGGVEDVKLYYAVGEAVGAIAAAVQGVNIKTFVYIYFGSLAPVIERLWDLPVAAIGADCATVPGNLDSLLRGPKSMGRGFGLIDARSTRMETPEVLVAHLERIAEAGAESWPCCWITPSAGLEFLPYQNAQAKMQRLALTTRQVAGQAPVG
ncbi:MAG: M28 family peptidase [Proteobacteria bacterium]|nr:M28 family peptidase [Pseudomonadota bacterium]